MNKRNKNPVIYVFEILEYFKDEIRTFKIDTTNLLRTFWSNLLIFYALISF